MTMLKNITADLGPREVWIGGKVIAWAESIEVDVVEATEEELAALKATPVILLVKPLPERINKEAKHEN